MAPDEQDEQREAQDDEPRRAKFGEFDTITRWQTEPQEPQYEQGSDQVRLGNTHDEEGPWRPHDPPRIPGCACERAPIGPTLRASHPLTVAVGGDGGVSHACVEAVGVGAGD